MDCGCGCGNKTTRSRNSWSWDTFYSRQCEEDWYAKTKNSPSDMISFEIDARELNDRHYYLERAKNGCQEAGRTLYEKWGYLNYYKP